MSTGSARLPFDPAGPFVVATEEIATNAGKLRRGDPFPVDGFSEFDILTLWGALKIDNVTDDALEAATAPPAFETSNMRLPPDQVATMRVTPDPPRAPAPSSKRHQRR